MRLNAYQIEIHAMFFANLQKLVKLLRKARPTYHGLPVGDEQVRGDPWDRHGVGSKVLIKIEK